MSKKQYAYPCSDFFDKAKNVAVPNNAQVRAWVKDFKEPQIV
jgi:hypothetical protein